MNYKTLVAASLMSVALSSAAFAQCSDCAMYPDRDYLNKGTPTPASRMMAEPAGAAGEPRLAGESTRGTHHRHYRDANASMTQGFGPANTGARGVYSKNLRDSGYNPAGDLDAAGNMKVN